jgi:signal transduction histidine kinase
MTAGGAAGLGFNRAILLLVDEATGTLRAETAVGPESPEQASHIWSEVSVEHRTLDDFLAEYDNLPPPELRPLYGLVKKMVFPLTDAEHLPMLAVGAHETVHVIDAEHDPRVAPLLRELLKTNEFVVAPLIVKDRVIGAAVADNNITVQPISQADVQLLTALANLAALGIDNARAYQEVSERASELTAAYQALQQMTEQKIRAEKLAVIGELTAIVAHEVRNPLATIGGFAHSIMRKPKDQERILRDAGIIVEEVERLEQILRELLDFARPQTPNAVPGNIGDVAESVVAMMRDDAATRNVRVEARIEDGLPLARFDPNQIKQVVVNLFRNAVEAMPNGGIVVIACYGEHGAARLSVEDTGMGIPKERLGAIFEAYVTSKPTGTGLGLALAKKIIEDHGARLAVESEEGKGTIFRILFPPVPADET